MPSNANEVWRDHRPGEVRIEPVYACPQTRFRFRISSANDSSKAYWSEVIKENARKRWADPEFRKQKAREAAMWK